MTAETSLYVPADEKGMIALNREWLAARVVLLAGFVLAIGFFAWWSYGHRAGADLAGDQSAVATDADTSASQDQMDQAISSGQTTKEGFAMCRLVIGTAQAFGIVPGSMKYVNGPAKTDIRGRYVCAANDQAGAQYAMTADLVCSNLQNAQCVNLVTVQKADGTVLFKRQDNDNAPPAAAADQGSAPLTGDAGTADTSGTDTGSTAGTDGSTGAPAGTDDGTQPPPQ